MILEPFAIVAAVPLASLIARNRLTFRWIEMLASCSSFDSSLHVDQSSVRWPGQRRERADRKCGDDSSLLLE
jgi:hypothetical protein